MTISSGASKPQRRRVADVQLDDAMAFFLEPRRFLQHRAADVVADIRELARLRDGPQQRAESAASHGSRSSLRCMSVALSKESGEL